MQSTSYSIDDVSYYGAGILRIPRGMMADIPRIPIDDTYDGISVLHLLRLSYLALQSPVIPAWWHMIADQVKQIQSAPDRPTIMKLPSDEYIVVGNHVESLHHWMACEMDSDGVDYSRFVGGTIAVNPQWGNDISERLERSGVSVTNVAATYISPETEQARRLRHDADIAISEGYSLPKPEFFPTQAHLYEHQKPAVLSLAWRGRGLLGDDVGSGKSAMFFNGFLSHAQYRIEHEGASYEDVFPLVIVTKKSLINNTEDECRMWFGGCKTYRITGNKPNDIPDDTHVIIATISSLASHVESIVECNPQAVIFDESHMVKSMKAARTRAAVALADYVKTTPSPYVVCASATPMPNRPSELWAQLHITGMSEPIVNYARSRQHFPERTAWSTRKPTTMRVDDQTVFEMRYCQGRPGYYGWDANGSSNEEELGELLRAEGFIRRKKSEFIHPLPLLYQQFIRCALSNEDKAKYLLAEKRFIDHLVLSLRTQAEQEQWSEALLREEIDSKISKAEHSEAIMKMTELRQMIGLMKVPSIVSWVHRFFAADPAIIGKDSGRNKLIIFAHHKEVQEAIITHPELQQYGVLSIKAGSRNISSTVSTFQDEHSGKNIIVCYSEAREGLTLTAAKDVLVAELPFQPSWLIQMAGRCWARFSRDYPPHEAHIHYATANVHIDNYLEDMIREKKWLNKVIIDGEKASDIINAGDSGVEDSDSSSVQSLVSSLVRSGQR